MVESDGRGEREEWWAVMSGNGEGGGEVRTDGGGVVLLDHHRPWVWDHCRLHALAICQWRVVLSMGTGGGSFPGC